MQGAEEGSDLSILWEEGVAGLGDLFMHLTDIYKAPAVCQTPGWAPGQHQ